MEDLGTVSIDDLSTAYRRHNVDIRRFFKSDRVTLRRSELGYFQFTDSMPGDAEFYGKLMRSVRYEEAKWEFEAAAREIGSSDAVLDIGCGAGSFEQYCKTYKGIELSEAAVADARSRGRHVYLEDLSDQPKSSFDVATLFQVLEHVDRPVDFLKQAASTVKPGGTVIVCVPDMDGALGRACNLPLNYPPHHMTWWSEEALENIAGACGIRPVKFRREPLQRLHFNVGFFACLHPRTGRHFDRSLRSQAMWLLSRILGRLVPRTVSQIPFMNGHSIMMIAKKDG